MMNIKFIHVEVQYIQKSPKEYSRLLLSDKNLSKA
jgi:hypothetical protein